MTSSMGLTRHISLQMAHSISQASKRITVTQYGYFCLSFLSQKAIIESLEIKNNIQVVFPPLLSPPKLSLCRSFSLDARISVNSESEL